MEQSGNKLIILHQRPITNIIEITNLINLYVFQKRKPN